MIGRHPGIASNQHRTGVGHEQQQRDTVKQATPAGATALIISLGIVTRPLPVLVIEIAAAILTLQAIVINRLAGIDYPLWALRDDSPRP